MSTIVLEDPLASELHEVAEHENSSVYLFVGANPRVRLIAGSVETAVA